MRTLHSLRFVASHRAWAYMCVCVLSFQVLFGVVYMFPKYMLRFSFWRLVGRACRCPELREVRNPDKMHKRREIAQRYGVQPGLLESHYLRIRPYFWLLP